MRRFNIIMALAGALVLAIPLGNGPVSLVTSAFAQKLIDINTASKADLDALQGIGPVHAEAIIKGRPYKRKDELVKKKIVPQSTYDSIKDKIIAHQKS